MDLERKDNGDSDEEQSGREIGEFRSFSFRGAEAECGSEDSFPLYTADGDMLVPAGVLRGIRQISEGKTADGDDLDDALSF